MEHSTGSLRDCKPQIWRKITVGQSREGTRGGMSRERVRKKSRVTFRVKWGAGSTRKPMDEAVAKGFPSPWRGGLMGVSVSSWSKGHSPDAREDDSTSGRRLIVVGNRRSARGGGVRPCGGG